MFNSLKDKIELRQALIKRGWRVKMSDKWAIWLDLSFKDKLIMLTKQFNGGF